MTRIKNLGTRIAIVPEDRYFNDISIGLYVKNPDTDPDIRVFSYAKIGGTAERLKFIADELARLAGLVPSPTGDGFRFKCGSVHANALSRIFTLICRRDPKDAPVNPSMTAFDKKAGCDISITRMGGGRYSASAAGDDPAKQRRVMAAMNGLRKLAVLDMAEQSDTIAAFPCGSDHDILIASLLPDALNVRGALREQDGMKNAGVLNSPGKSE